NPAHQNEHPKIRVCNAEKACETSIGHDRFPRNALTSSILPEEVCDAIRPFPNGLPLLDTSPLCKLVNAVLLQQWKLDTTVWHSSESSPLYTVASNGPIQ
uniref:Uncharacterized protein n=1 Tax=Caenorhabditis japonica TaxID=281687 RepID=A0A8R1DW12_CAEJA